MRTISIFFLLLFTYHYSWSQVNADSSKTSIDSLQNPIPNILPDSSKVTPAPRAIDSTSSVKENKPEVPKNQVVYFLKNRIEGTANSTIFNILIVKNTTASPLNGNIVLSIPDSWQFISTAEKIPVNLNPGDSIYIPVRIAMGVETKGDVANIINASLKTDKGLFSGNFFVKVPKKSMWYFSTDQNTVYFNEYFEDVKFNCHLQNRGNADELIKLSFEIGKLLDVLEIPGNETEMFIKLPPNSDTTLLFSVTTNKLSWNDQQLYEQIWKESTVNIKASTRERKSKQTIWFKKIQNEHNASLEQKLFPLNYFLQFNNLVASLQPRFNTGIYGTTLLDDQRELNYRLAVINAVASPNEDQKRIETDQNLVYFLNYKDSTKSITVGNLNNTGILFSGIGRGVSGKYQIAKDHEVGAAYSRNIFLPIDNYSAQYSTNAINKLSISYGANYEDNQVNDNQHIINQLRTNYVFLGRHRLGAGIRNTNSTINYIPIGTVQETDTTLSNLGYEMSYYFSGKKLRVQFNYNDYRNIETKGGGFQYIRANSFYFLENGARIHALYFRTFQDLNRFPITLLNQEDNIVNEMGRITYGKNITKSIFYEVGPFYNFFEKKNPSSRLLNNQFATRTISAFGSLRFQLNTFSSISPFLTYGLSFVDQKDSIVSDIQSPTVSVRAGANYRNRYWSINVFYSNGPVNFFEAQSFANQGIRSQVLNIRPSYDRSFLQRKLKYTAFFNYIVRSPSIRENTTFTNRIDFYPNNKWHLYGIGNLFSSSYNDEEAGRVSNRSFNLIVGVRKSFAIQQPRMKKYNLKLVLFNDLNGNKSKDPDEPPLANIITEIEAAGEDKKTRMFRQMQFVSNTDGEINYYGIANGEYKMTFSPMENLGDLYNINGTEQTVMVNSNTTYFVPYGESYKIVGKIILIRDKFSSENSIDANGIRVTAKGPNNEVYSVLTDKTGSYTLFVPQADFYVVSVANIFGENFILENDSYTVQFSDFKTYKLDFSFLEKKREINIEGGDYQFNLNRNKEEEE